MEEEEEQNRGWNGLKWERKERMERRTGEDTKGRKGRMERKNKSISFPPDEQKQVDGCESRDVEGDDTLIYLPLQRQEEDCHPK